MTVNGYCEVGDEGKSEVDTELILWDNDGVLVDTEGLYYEATKVVLADLGVELTESHYAQYWLKQSEGIARFLADSKLNNAQIQNLRARRNEVYSTFLRERNTLIEGVFEVLKVLKPHFRMGVVTSSHHDHFKLIHSKTGILPYFEFALKSGDYTQSKPAPDPYLKALEIAKVPCEKCLAVEDSERGLIAAKAAGLCCWIIPRGLSAGGDFSTADRVLNSVREVPKALGCL
jgi:HAD superfamily hydrolase (TIGR01509 family)